MLKLHIIKKGNLISYINRSLVDFMTHIGEYSIIKEFSFIKVYGAKFPPNVLPITCTIYLFMLELVRQSAEDYRVKMLKKFNNIPWLHLPYNFGFYLFNSH